MHSLLTRWTCARAITCRARLSARRFGHRLPCVARKLREMAIVGQHLLQMPQPCRSRGPDHGLTVRALDPESRRTSDRLAQLREQVGGIALAKIYREHAPTCAAAERGMLGVMVEQDQITGLGLQRNGRHLAAVDAPQLLAPADLPLKRLRIAILREETAWDHAQAAGVGAHLLEIQGHLDVQYAICPP